MIFDHVLLCTDYSENAQKAIDDCFFFFKSEPRDYTLISTYMMEQKKGEDLLSKNDTLRNQNFELLKSETERIQKLPYANVAKIEYLPVFGNPVNVILRMAESNKYDLVVLGHQGKNYHSTRLFGSLTKKLIDDPYLPCLTVPKKEYYKKQENQLILADAQNVWNKQWWENMLEIAQQNQLRPHLIILPDQEEKSTQLPDYVCSQSQAVHSFIGCEEGEFHTSFYQIFQQIKPSLLCLCSSQVDLIHRLLKTHELTIFNMVPLLISHTKVVV